MLGIGLNFVSALAGLIAAWRRRSVRRPNCPTEVRRPSAPSRSLRLSRMSRGWIGAQHLRPRLPHYWRDLGLSPITMDDERNGLLDAKPRRQVGGARFGL